MNLGVIRDLFIWIENAREVTIDEVNKKSGTSGFSYYARYT